MQSIPFHIAYLLVRHECVIVPGLGAFIVSSSDKKKTSRWGLLLPPENFLGFNPDIKHNDGSLANSVAKGKGISDEEANLLIDQYVTHTLQSLDEGETVQISGVGTLCLKDNKILFQPDKSLSCNAFNYGLTKFSLPYLKDIQQEANILPQKEDEEIVWTSVSRKHIAYICSIAAVFLCMCIIPVPLNNVYFGTEDTQYASFIQFSTQNATDEEAIVSEPKIQMQTDSSVTQTKSPIQHSNVAKALRLHYYIIIANAQDLSSAEETLTALQSKGFENAAILRTDERYRIYMNHFEDKKEAEQFLIQFRDDYPEYARAWLLSSLPPNPFE